MRVHRTQIAPDDPWLNLPEEMTRELMQTDSYVRIRSLVDAPLPENDLFTGLRQVNPELS
jgi:mycothiol S-conjugate amidase